MRANYFLRKINHFVVVVVIINLLSFDIRWIRNRCEKKNWKEIGGFDFEKAIEYRSIRCIHARLTRQLASEREYTTIVGWCRGGSGLILDSIEIERWKRQWEYIVESSTLDELSYIDASY